jgi:hypothetical protein
MQGLLLDQGLKNLTARKIDDRKSKPRDGNLI